MAFEGVGEVQFGVGVYPADCAIGPIAGPSEAATGFNRRARTSVVKG